MARILVVYGTAYGQTERIARRIVDRLRFHGHEVCMYKGDSLPKHLRIDDYDEVVLAASIIRGRHQRYIRDFARRHHEQLNHTRSAFVSVSGSAQGSPEQARQYIDEFVQQTGWNPRFPASFAGSMAYTQYGPLLRWMTKFMSKRRGGPTDTSRDHEFTDWQAVDRYAERLAKAMRPSPKSERIDNVQPNQVHDENTTAAVARSIPATNTLVDSTVGNGDYKRAPYLPPRR
jgi:menaquinone-dependent protoporphyrinogen oxidase